MKKQLLTGIIIISAVTAIILLTSNTEPKTDEGNLYITMRTVEASVGNMSAISIINENNEKEKIPLKKLKPDVSVNMEIINQTINEIAGKGYSLISTSGGGDNYVIFTTYIFKKDN